jgi:type IV pilus assembly protein PilC
VIILPIFTYKARDISGRIVTGQMEAETQRVVINKLRQQKLFVISAEEAKPSKFVEFIKRIGIFARVKLRDLVLFSRQLATLINAGIPIVQCLNVLVDQVENRYFKGVITNVREDIEKGSSICTALEKYPNIFSPLYTSMVRSGESGGVLDEVLERLSVYLENLQELRRKVIGAMIYPAIIAFVAIAVVLFLLIIVVPQFQNVFESFGAKLPIPTQILIKVANWLKHWIWLILLIGFGIFIGVFLVIKNSEKARYKFDNMLLKLPLLGPIFRKVSVARFARTLGTLTRSGVPILESLEIVAKTTGNKVIEKAVLGARSSIREGERITDPLRESGVFPPLLLQMTAVGEETGALDSMLLRVADYYDREVDAAVAALASMIEPLLIVVLGVIVGTIVICMYLPIFTISQIIGR